MSRIIERAEQLANPALRKFFTYWDTVRGGRAMPRRCDIDPIDMPRDVLPHVVLLDVVREPLDFRYRLAGTIVVERSGFELKGRLVSELPITRPAELYAEFAKVERDGRPRHSEFSYRARHDEYRNVERLIAPLSDDGRSIGQLIGVAVFHAMTIGEAFET